MPFSKVPKILILVQSLILISFTALSSQYEFPKLGTLLGDLTEDPNLRIYLNSSNQYPDKYVTMQAKGPHLTRMTKTGQLQIFDIYNNSTLKYYLFQNITSQLLQMTAFDICELHPNKLAVIFGNNTGKFFQLLANGTTDQGVDILFDQTQTTFATGIEQNGQTTFVLGYNGTHTNFQMITEDNITNKLNKFFMNTNINTMVFNIKTCYLSGTYYVALWKRNCLIKIYNCNENFCFEVHSKNSSACQSNDYYSSSKDNFDLEFSADCQYVLYQQRIVGVNIYDTLSMSVLTTFIPFCLFTTDNTMDIWFYDTENHYIGSYFNMTFQVNQLILGNPPFVIKRFVTSLPYLGLTAYSYLGNAFFLSYRNAKLNKYNFICNTSGYVVTSKGLCEPAPPSQPFAPAPTNNTISSNTSSSNNNTTSSNTTNSSSITNNNNTSPTNMSSSNNTNPSNTTNTTNTSSQSSNTTQITNQTIIKNNTNTTHKKQNLNEISAPSAETQMVGVFESYKPISAYQQAVGSTVSDSFTIITIPVTYLISIFKFFPFAFLFLRFINFWSICTMYLIPKIIFPTYLTDILAQIYTQTNKSMFETFDIQPTIQTQTQEKFEGDDAQFFGFSSDLLNANIQTFSIMLFSWLILLLFYILSKILPKHNFIRKYLRKINYKMAIIAQYVSIMNAFYFNLPIISSKGYQNNFTEKINIASQNFLIIFSTFTTCFSYIFLDKEAKKKSQKEETSQEKLAWFVDCMYNSLLPFITIIRNIHLFLGVNFVLFMLPVYSAYKETEFRAWKIIQSLYLPLFNLGVIGMMLFDRKKFPQVYHNLALLITVLIFLGAVHELLGLFGGLFYDLILLIKSKFMKVSDEFQESKLKQKQAELSLIPKFSMIKGKRESLVVKRLILKKNDVKLEQKKEPNKSRFGVKEGQNGITLSPNQNLKLQEEKKQRRKMRMKFLKQHMKISPYKIASFDPKLQNQD